MTRTLTLIAALALLAAPALAQTTSLRDGAGREIGYARRNQDGGSTFFNEKGQQTGRTRRNQDGSVAIYDRAGREVGYVRPPARR